MATTMYKAGDKVIFGRFSGEQTKGTVLSHARTMSAKYKVRQDEARGVHAVGSIWTVPASLMKLVGPEAPKVVTARRNSDEIMADFRATYSRLSPECLSCDGEASRAHIAAQGAALRRRLRELAVEFGRMVSESEAYGYRDFAR